MQAVIDLKSKEIKGFPSSLLISQTGEIYRNWAHYAPLTSNSLEVAKFGFASMRQGTVSHNFMNDLKVSRHFPIILTSWDIIFCRKLILTDTSRSFPIIFECVLNNVLLPPLKNITITPFLSLTRYLHSLLLSLIRLLAVEWLKYMHITFVQFLNANVMLVMPFVNNK